jgi:hypothetical protein
LAVTNPPLGVVVRAEQVPSPGRVFVAIAGQAEVPVLIDRLVRNYGGEQVFSNVQAVAGGAMLSTL